LGLGPKSPNSTAASPQQQQPGIVDRVSGAVTSLFAGSPKETGEDVQHTFPAHSDNVPRVGGKPNTVWVLIKISFCRFRDTCLPLFVNFFLDPVALL